MGGGGWDWQDQQTYRESKAKKESSKVEAKDPLVEFSDRELQTELRKRKAHAKTEAERMEAKRLHNAPIERKISELHQEINRLKAKLKK